MVNLIINPTTTTYLIFLADSTDHELTLLNEPNTGNIPTGIVISALHVISVRELNQLFKQLCSGQCQIKMNFCP